MRQSLLGLVVLIAGMTARASRAQENVVPAAAAVNPPSAEVTEEKKVALSQEMADLDATAGILDELGSATVKRKGEGSREYVQRVDKIFKAQAYLIHLLHQRVESGLDAKYQLEAQVGEYAQWVENLSARMGTRVQSYRANVDVLNKDLQEVRYDGQVLAYLIVNQGGFEKPIQDKYRKQFPPEGVQGVPGYQARQEKFLQIPKEKWQQEFHNLVRQVQSKELRRQFLLVQAIPQTKELSDSLPAEHKRVLQEATEVLQRYSELEITADKIAVAAEFARENLDLINGFVHKSMLDTADLEQAESAARKLEGGLSKVVPAGVTGAPRDLMMMTGTPQTTAAEQPLQAK